MEFVVARYDLDKVYRELVVSLIVPIVLFVISSISLCIITKSVKVGWLWLPPAREIDLHQRFQVGDDAKMRCVCAGDDSDDDGFGNAAGAKQPEQVYDTDDDVVDLEQQAVELDVTAEPAHPFDTQEMIGSTKSLIPLSPTEQQSTDEQDEKAAKCDVPEKPLVIL